MSSIAEGLEGIVVARTALSHVDGEAGLLTIGGHSVEDIAGHVSFEDAVDVLAKARAAARADTRAALAAGRVRAFTWLASHKQLAGGADAMDALRSLVGALPAEDPWTDAATLIGATAVFAAAHAAARTGRELLAPDPTRSHAEDYLRLVVGHAPDPAAARALDAYLVTVIDHGLNASTFAARVVASTGSDLVSSITAAIGALKGPLHGGAPGPVLDMLDAIGAADRAEAWLGAELAAGRRIMGMGHRVYRVRDPRAAVLERALAALEQARAGETTGRLALARGVEGAAARLLATKYPERSLQANVEFYTAVLLDAVGLPRWLFSATFAVGRVAGWCAHVAEQRARGRLIRPSSEYDGPVYSSRS